jgi:hypothetical protein
VNSVSQRQGYGVNVWIVNDSVEMLHGVEQGMNTTVTGRS